jgi:hypothetical protein
LLDFCPGGGAAMLVFLSYAEEDGTAAAEVATALSKHGASVYWFQKPAERGQRFLRRIETVMSRADRFIALMSPSFLASLLCNRESEFAIHREDDMQAIDPTASFVTVLEVVPTPIARAGLLRSYDWLRARDSHAREAVLAQLVASIPSSDAEIPGHDGEDEPWFPSFRNRDNEIEEVVRGLTNVAGTHFWLVIAPPQLGKTWFINHLAMKLLEERDGWAGRRVDLKDQPDGERWDARRLIEQLFGVDRLAEGFSAACRQVAQVVLRRRKFHLCILDSTEQLDRESIGELRAYLGEIYRIIQQARNHDVRLVVVAASRRDDGWQKVQRGPRFGLLPLTEFSLEVVQRALDDLALKMGFRMSPPEMWQNARIVREMSEGLPALLVHCLRWIQSEQWVDIERLREDPRLFEKLAIPYIREILLAEESLFPRHPEDGQERCRTLVESFRVLAPYRFFTQSHLRYHIASDQVLHNALEESGWSVEKLWNYLTDSAILARPPAGPWLTTSAPIRRLLYRYFHRTDESRSEIHFQASEFMRTWAEVLTGSDQVTGLIESFWHEAAGLHFSQSEEMDSRLRVSAGKLFASLRETQSLSFEELRKNAADRLDADEEFQGLIESVAGLSDELQDMIRSAEET